MDVKNVRYCTGEAHGAYSIRTRVGSYPSAVAVSISQA